MSELDAELEWSLDTVCRCMMWSELVRKQREELGRIRAQTRSEKQRTKAGREVYSRQERRAITKRYPLIIDTRSRECKHKVSLTGANKL